MMLQSQNGWTCKDVDSLLDRGLREPGALPGEASQHLQGCTRCRELHAFMTSDSQKSEPAPEILGKIHATLVADLRPVSPLPRTRAMAGRILVAGGILVLAITAMKGAAGTSVMNPTQMAATGVLFLGFAILFALSLSKQLVPGSAHDIPPPVLIPAFLLGFVGSVAVLFSWHEPLTSAASGWGCTARGVSVALVASVMLILLLRRGAVQEITMFGATLGATSGLIAAAVLQFNCFRQDAPHLLAWHATVPLLSAAIGFLAGAAWQRRSERPVS